MDPPSRSATLRWATEVLATDPETKQTSGKTVEHVWAHLDVLVGLEIDGHVLIPTEDYPSWDATDGAWEEAQDLDPATI